MSWVLWLCSVVVCWRPVVCESNDIAMEIQGRLEGRSSFIKLRDIDRAFAEARRRVNLTRPAREPLTDPDIALLGTALQETTRILADKFQLNGLEILADLPRIDTSRTAIQDFCPRHLILQRDCGVPGRYRSIDGSCNNLNHPTWGAARTTFRRLVDPEYGDGISSPRVGVDGYALPAARHVTSHVHRDVVQEHEQSITFMFVAWGQLVDHDLTLTAEAKDAASRTDPDCCRNPNAHPNCMPLVVPRDDQFYGYYNRWCIIMLRSLAGVRSGCRLGTRVQFNALTSYIDANFVYGSNPIVADSLRTFRDGLLRTVPAFQDIGLKPLLPPKIYQPLDGCVPPSPNIYCFLAGENRVNEQLALAVLHTMFVREHNRIARELGRINRHWGDDRLYQETRHIVAAVTQHITYNEFLPRLLGEETLRKYNLTLLAEGHSREYNDEVDASVPTAFAAAAFRFGHSLLPRALERWSPSHQYVGARRLSSVIQRPFDLYKPGAYDLYLLGMVNQLAMAMDSSVTEEVTNHLFQPPDSDFGRDLAATNLGRGRENGIPGINRYRRLCGLPEINSWDEMHHHMPNGTVSEYHFMYSHPDDVDLWSAGVSERPLRGSIVGPTFNCLIALTFRDLKRGDRFWYENGGWPSSFTADQLKSIKSIRLSRLICDNSDTIETVQMRAMEVHHFKTNPRVSCASNRLPHLNLRLWREDENEDFKETGFNKPGTIILTEETDNLENNVSPPEYSDY